MTALGCGMCRDYSEPGWLGWNGDGSRVRCSWCNPGEAPVHLAPIRTQRRKAVVDERFAWELICERPGGDLTERLNVPGGWLYRTLLDNGGENSGWSVAMVFVPYATLSRTD